MTSLLIAAMIQFVEIDPGHFHAGLVLNRTYDGVSPDVEVFAPGGSDLDGHLKLVSGFNSRATNPTAWREHPHTGVDYLEQFRTWTTTANVAQSVVVMSGRNNVKPGYYRAAVEAGCNVLCDKPMAITGEAFETLKTTAELARRRGLLFSDIMTERHEITTILQRELVADRALYGEQERGTPDDPAVTKVSVHHFCKLVDGKPLRRPGWYYDTAQQGEAIVDVTTHLVDLVQWETFPGTTLSIDDVKMISARKWATPISAADYQLSTGLAQWPEYLRGAVDANGVLQCLANGEFTWTLRGVHAKVAVEWHFMPPKGTGDTHYSMMRGTKAEVTIRQDASTGYKPTLFVIARGDAEATGKALTTAIARIAKSRAGVTAIPTGKRSEWRIAYPKAYDIGHEAHFSQVVAEYLEWMRAGKMPDSRRTNMLVKYYTLNEARKAAK